MAQDFTASMRELWASDHLQIDGLYSPAERLSGKIAEKELQATNGNSYTYLQIGINEGTDIDPYGDTVVQDSSDTKTTLVLDKTSQYDFHQEEDEKGRYQAFDSFKETHFKASVLEHYRKTNGEFFFQVFNSATNVFDDGNLGGTAGNPITMTSSNIDDFAFELSAELEEQAEMGGGFATVLPPKQLAKLNLAAFGSGSSPAGDAFDGKLNLGIENSFVGSYFETDFYKTKLVPTGKKITYTDQPADTNTLVVDGVTITMVASLTGGDGEVLIGADADATYANLIALLNNPAINTANAKGWAINGANYRKARYFGGKLTAAGVVAVVSKNGKKAITETLANATLGTDVISWCPIMRYGSVEMACPRGVRLTSGKNKNGTVTTHTSRKRFGVATPSQYTTRFAVAEVKVG